MPKYEVTMHEVYHVKYIVEADNKEDAAEKVRNGGIEPNDPSEWDVCDMEMSATFDVDTDVVEI